MSPSRKSITKPVSIYVRVSRVGSRDVEADGGSAAEQERKCRQQLELLDLQAGEVFVDLDESGGKESRPEFDRMLRGIEDGTSGGVVVWKLSRFGRRVRHVLRQINWVESHGAVFLCVTPNIDTSGAYGKFTLTLFAALDELELDNLTEGWRSSRDSALSRGVRVGVPPAGFRKGPDGRLVKDAADAEKIALAYQYAGERRSWSEVARALEGVSTSRRSGGKWTALHARNLLASKIYRGVLGTYADGTECIVPELRIVPPSVWEKANEPRAEKGKRHSNGASLLAGICHCAGCGRALTLSVTHKGGRDYGYLKCTSGPQFCSARASIERETIETYVQHMALSEPRTWESGEARDAVKQGAFEQTRDDAKTALRAAIKGGISDLDPFLLELRSDVEAAEAALAEYLASTGVKRLSRAEALEMFGGGSVEDRRSFLRQVLADVRVAGTGRDGPVETRTTLLYATEYGGAVLDPLPTTA